MNFTTYDNVKQKLDRTKTWVNPKYKQVFSAEIKYHHYCQIIRKYIPEENIYEYYIAFMDNKDFENKSCRLDELGRTRINISEIWNDFCKDISVDTNVILEYIESINGADIFKLSR